MNAKFNQLYNDNKSPTAIVNELAHFIKSTFTFDQIDVFDELLDKSKFVYKLQFSDIVMYGSGTNKKHIQQKISLELLKKIFLLDSNYFSSYLKNHNGVEKCIVGESLKDICQIQTKEKNKIKENNDMTRDFKNYIGLLNECSQHVENFTVDYKYTKQGLDNKPEFLTTCIVNYNDITYKGTGISCTKKISKQNAAKFVYEEIFQ